MNPYLGPYAVFANGTYYLRAFNAVTGVWSTGSSSVVVSNFPVATPPPAPVAAVNPSCAPIGTTISVAAAPAGYDYYWQGTVLNGSSTAINASAPYGVTSSGTYYVSALETASGCWSNTVGTLVTVSTIIPPSPTLAQASIDACSGIPSIPLTAAATGINFTYTVNLFDSFGDGWNGALLDVLVNGTVVLNDITFTTGSSAIFNLTVAEGSTISTFWVAGGSYPGECSYNIKNEVGTIIGSAFTAPITPYNVPMGMYTLNWFDAATAGNNLGTGTNLEAVGSTIMPTAALGSYDFYVTQTLGGCSSAAANAVVNVVDVNVALTPINETCTAYGDGSFIISTVSCGVAPFTYSVDGGAFGATPTNLTAGTYSVIVKDNNAGESSPITVVIGTTGTVIPNTPTLPDSSLFVCTNTPSVQLNADGNISSIATLLTTMAAGNGSSGNMFSITAANNTTITEFAINADPGIGDYEIHYRPDDYLLTPGSNSSSIGWTLVGTATGITSATGTYTPLPIPVNITIPAGSTYSFHVVQTTGPGVSYTNGTALGAPYVNDANITVNQGHGGSLFNCPNSPRVFNGLISYESTIPASVVWFDAAGGNEIGNVSPLEAVGTSVLPNTATAGSFDFFVSSYLNGCYSLNSAVVTVNVSPVNVTIDPIDAICNGSGTGSFIISNVQCGTAPFTFSVDGGAFGAAPINLTAGTYSVIVKDGSGNVSSAYPVVIGEAGAPSDIVMVDINDNGGQVSWNSNGTETSWFVEYGLPGFTPGTGTQIGTATVADTFAIIAGLDGNTTYDIYVSADCGAGQTIGSWTAITFTTDCGIYGIPFVETFEDSSATRVCWYNINEVGTSDWTYETGSSGGAVNTAFEGSKNARFVSEFGTLVTKLASPRFDFAGQDSVAVVFAYAQEQWFGDQNTTKVYSAGASTNWTEIASYTSNVNEWTVDTLFVSDTTIQIAFEGTNNFGYANVVDYVQILPCTLAPGIDGSADVCRLDNTFDLNTIITKGETFGYWSFPANELFLNGSIANVGLLPAGTYDFYYVVKTPCANDTTIASLTIFDPSTAGNDGSVTVCRNEPVDLLSALSGNVDLGGEWYNPSNQIIPSSFIYASNIPGQFNYDYITGNGVCPDDTSNVLVNVDMNCNWLEIDELYFGSLSISPNPTNGMVYISNEGSKETFNYEITNLDGRLIDSKLAAINGTSSTKVDLSGNVTGMYIIRVFNDNAEKVFRIILQ